MNKHLIEIKRRLLYFLIWLVVVFIPLFYFAPELYLYLAKPMQSYLPQGGALIATKVTSPFLIPLKLSFYLALYLSMPALIYNIWSFIAPGLYAKEKKTIRPIIAGSIILFYIGTIFSYIVLCPISLKFFNSLLPSNILMLPDIANYLDYLLALLFGGGIAFQIPIAIYSCYKLGIFDKKQLSSIRRHVIVLAFILGMLLTPPDVISQIILALPMWGLYEISLLLCREK